MTGNLKRTPRSKARRWQNDRTRPTAETPARRGDPGRDGRPSEAGQGRPDARPAASRRPPASAPSCPTTAKRRPATARAKTAEAREKARVGMAAGDDRYLTARDRGPQRRYVRDYVDARFNIGEFLIPVMLLVIVLTFLPGLRFQVYGLLALWAFFVIAVIDCVVLGFLRAHAGSAPSSARRKVEKGVRWYARDARPAAARHPPARSRRSSAASSPADRDDRRCRGRLRPRQPRPGRLGLVRRRRHAGRPAAGRTAPTTRAS